MSDDVLEYCKNLKRFHELNQFNFLSIKSDEELLQKEQELIFEKRNLKNKNDAFLEKYLVPYEKDVSKATDKDIENLIEIFTSLKNGSECYDRIVSYRISIVLFRHYLQVEEWNKAIRTLFNMMYLNGTIADHSYEREMDDFSIIIEFVLENYFEYLDETGKDIAISIILYCCYFPLEKSRALERFGRAEFFISKYNVEISKNNDSLFYTYKGAVLDVLNQMLESVDEGKLILSESQKEKCRELLNLVDSHIANNEYVHHENPARLISIQMHFHLGDIDINEALLQMKNLREVGNQDLLIDKCTVQFRIPAIYIKYLWLYKKCPIDEKANISFVIMEEVKESCRIKKNNQDKFYDQLGISELVIEVANNLGFKKSRDFVLFFTVYEDVMLYIHTNIVKDISLLILENIIEEKPEFLEGIMGLKASEVKSKKLDLLDLLKDCALFHDIGKYFCLDYVSNDTRDLTKEEIRMIQYHAVNYDAFFGKETEGVLGCIRDCARLHHRWYDESAGYPEESHTLNKPFVSIISVADCFDAASDYMGRSYKTMKNIDELTKEFVSFKGTRYDPVVVDILFKPNIISKVTELVSIKNRNILGAGIHKRHK